MLKLTCGLSNKVGEPNYGSRGASVAVEVELDPVAFRQPEKLRQHIRCAFDRVREAIDEELARPGPTGRASDGGEPATNGDRPRPGNGLRPVTANQLRVLRAIAGRRGEDLDEVLRGRLGKEAGRLTLAEASSLIDELGGAAKDRPR